MDPTVDLLAHANVSRRDVVVRLGAGGLAALLLATSRASAAVAQDASPAASPTGAVGVTTQLMGSGQPSAAPGLELSLRRITLAPGDVYLLIAIREHWSSSSRRAHGATPPWAAPPN